MISDFYTWLFPDPGNRARHSISLLTAGDFVIKADDDILPKPGLVQDFLDQHNRFGKGIYGVIGRRFNGPSYYKNTEFCRASKLPKGQPQPVDFVGVCTFTPRDYLAFDLIDCDTPIEDLHWQMKHYPNAKKFVVASDKYENLPTCKSGKTLFHDPKMREKREAFYSYWYNHYYKTRHKDE
jgi:hypothetical protein